MNWKQLRNLASKKQIQRISQTTHFPLCIPFQKTYLWCWPWPCDSERSSPPSQAGNHRGVWPHHKMKKKSLSWILSGGVDQLSRLLQQRCKTSQNMWGVDWDPNYGHPSEHCSKNIFPLKCSLPWGGILSKQELEQSKPEMRLGNGAIPNFTVQGTKRDKFFPSFWGFAENYEVA